MKKIIYSFVGLILILNGAYISIKEVARYKKRSFKAIERNIAAPVSHAMENKHFVILVMSYNNSKYCTRNLESIFEQDYDNYRVIYIDDASTDDTYEKVQTLIAEYGKESKVTLIRNPKNHGAMQNLYRSVHSCKKDEIIAIVDGDDFLAREDVLTRLNQYYADPKVWVTYGNYLRYPDYQKGWNEPLEKKVLTENTIRSHRFVTTHLRSFYAGLFQQIRLSDFLYQGSFYPTTSDVASMTPLIELAGEHVYYIPEIFYLYNYETSLNDEKIRLDKQQFYDNYIRQLSKYSPLTIPPWEEEKQEKVVDLITFSFNRPLQLYAFLESLYKHSTGLGKVFVLYRGSDESYAAGYNLVKEKFPEITFVQQSSEFPRKDFKPLLIKTLYFPGYSTSRYVAFAVDDLVVTDHIDFKDTTKKLRDFGAYAFYLRLGKNINYSFMNKQSSSLPKVHGFDENLMAWQFCSGELDWDYPNSVDLTVFDKEEIKSDLSKVKFANPSELEHKWNEIANHSLVGLSYDHSKAVGLPLNIVTNYKNIHLNAVSVEELLEKFMKGFKFNIEAMAQVENVSSHIDYMPEFVIRE